MRTEAELCERLKIIDYAHRVAGNISDFADEFNQIIEECKEAEWNEGYVWALFLRARHEQFSRDMPRALATNNEAKALATHFGFENLRIDCDAAEANLALWINDVKHAYVLALNTLPIAIKANNYYAVTNCHFVLGTVSERYGFDDEAIKYFNWATQIAREHGFFKLEAVVLDQTAQIFFSRMKFKYAEKCALELLKLQLVVGNMRTIARARIKLVTIYIEENKIDQAMKLLPDILAVADQLPEVEQGSIGLCHAKMAQKAGRMDEARAHCLRAIEIYLKHDRSILISNAYSILCELELECNQAAAALAAAQAALECIKTGISDYMETQIYRLMYESAKMNGNISDALKYLELYNARLVKQESELLETRIQFIEVHTEYQMKHAEITHERRRVDDLHIELESKARELTEKTRHLIKQTDAITQFRDDLRAIITRSQTTDPLIDEIKERLKTIQAIPLTWEDFYKDFEIAHPQYLSRLKESHPNLSPMELKICIMLRLGLTSIDMAKLLRLAERSIENHRYRVRKKLNLQAEKSMQELLSNI